MRSRTRLPPAGIVAGKLIGFATNAIPEIAMREMVRFAAPEFVSVKGAFATVFTVTVPKLWLAAETVNCGAELPVEAVSITGSGVPGSPLKLKVPADLPVRLPLYQRVKLDFSPGRNESGNFSPEMEKSLTEIVAFVSVTVVLLLFTTEALWETCLPTPTFPKSTAAGTT